jgi:phosphoribosylanthranilate isomerase
MFIKASAISNLSDARYFAAQYSVEFMGFCLDEGNDAFISPHLINAMKEWIAGPKIVGEFGIQDEDEILQQVHHIGLEVVQLAMFSTASTEKIRTQVPVIQEIVIEKDSTANQLLQLIEGFLPKADYLLLDFEKNAWSFTDLVRNQEISLDLLQRVSQKHPIIISINADAKQLKTLAQSIQPQGISLKGGEEERVGYKSFDELNDIFDALD